MPVQTRTFKKIWGHWPMARFRKKKSLCIEAEEPTPNPEIPKKHRVYTNFFEKFAWIFALFPVTQVRNPTEIIHKNSFRWNFLFWVDFFGWIFLLWVYADVRCPSTCSSLSKSYSIGSAIAIFCDCSWNFLLCFSPMHTGFAVLDRAASVKLQYERSTGFDRERKCSHRDRDK